MCSPIYKISQCCIVHMITKLLLWKVFFSTWLWTRVSINVTGFVLAWTVSSSAQPGQLFRQGRSCNFTSIAPQHQLGWPSCPQPQLMLFLRQRHGPRHQIPKLRRTRPIVASMTGAIMLWLSLQSVSGFFWWQLTGDQERRESYFPTTLWLCEGVLLCLMKVIGNVIASSSVEIQL